MTSSGSRPGDRRVKVMRVEPERITVAPARQLRRPRPPAVVLVLGFAGLIAVGTLVLMLPIASADGEWTGVIDALFTATSAVCVTGLVVVDTGTYWSPFGQAVILILIQLGGFGFMTSSTLLLILLARRRTTLRDRVLVQESLGTRQLGGGADLVKRVAVFTLIAETFGAAILIGHQLVREGAALEDLWWGLFHAVSAFNNAGFDVTGDFRSLLDYQTDWIVVPTIAILVFFGGIGFAIVADVWRAREWTRLALETKVVLVTTGILLVVGGVTIGISEWNNPATLGALSTPDRLLNAAFHSVTPRTAGFSTLDVGALFAPTLLLTMGLMFIGGASGSTAGGIKVNTFSVMAVAIVSTVRGRPSAEAFGRRIPHAVIYRALSVGFLFVLVAFAVALILQVENPGTDFVETTFEAVSALGTVGLSTGVTPELPDPARLLVTLTMFMGRLGPLTLVLALAARAHPVPYRPAVETLRIG